MPDIDIHSRMFKPARRELPKTRIGAFELQVRAVCTGHASRLVKP